MMKQFNVNFSGVYSLYLAEHASLGYSLWLVFFQLLHEGVAFVQIADIFLAGLSIFSYYQILRRILGNRLSNKTLALATMPYAFSPFVLGIVGNFNLDSATMYFAVIFIACSLYHYEALEMVFAFFFCFTKEPAIIYYFSYIVAKIICEYLRNNSFSFGKIIKVSFANIKNYIYALPVFLWAILYILNPAGGWVGEGSNEWSNTGYYCFGISTNVIEAKLKQTFFLNFNWVFWGILVIGGIILITRKIKIDKDILEKLTPISIMGVIIIIFGCLYVTWTHARYIAPLIPVLYMATAIILFCINLKESYFNIINNMLAVCLLAQSFYTIDPVMKNVFPALSAGSEKIYSMQLEGNERISDDTKFHDSIVYNRQYAYWPETLTKTLREAGYNGSMLIVLPKDINCTRGLLIGSDVLWDPYRNKMVYSKPNINNPQNCVSLRVCDTAGAIEEEIDTLDSSNILYIVPAWAEIDTGFVSNKKIVKEGIVNNKGFSVHYMILDLRYKLPFDEGDYIISPKLDTSLGICVDDSKVILQKNPLRVNLMARKTRYTFRFDEERSVLDVLGGKVNESGTVQACISNDTIAQKWLLKEIDGYYMICWYGYALTYDLNDNSIRLTPITGEDNQLWSFTQ